MFYLYNTIFFSLAKQIIKAIFVHCVFPCLKALARLNIALKILVLVPKSSLIPDLDRLMKWSEKWQMLNFGKCKCLHTGNANLDVNYKMGDTVLGTTVKEKYLLVTISSDMKVSEQCGIAPSKGNQILGLIRRNITYKEKTNYTSYKAIFRPHLEYGIQAWIPYRKKGIDTLEHIQRRATKIIPELRDLSYEERLKE